MQTRLMENQVGAFFQLSEMHVTWLINAQSRKINIIMRHMNKPRTAQENQYNYMDLKIYIFLNVTRDKCKIIQLHLKRDELNYQ